ncbi:MAG: hypothetical protein ACXWC4_19935 [Telluria sp.]
MRILLPTFLAVLVSSSGSPVVASAQCQLSFMVPQDGSLSIGKTTVSLGEPDSKDQPTAWQGPLKTEQCAFDPGIIEQPIAMTPGGWLYVSSYSGSARTITLYDLKTCSIRWQSDSFAGKLELNSRELRLGDKKMMLDDACVPSAAARAHQSALR